MYQLLAEEAVLPRQKEATFGENGSSAFTGAVLSNNGFSSSLSHSLIYSRTLSFSSHHHWRSVGLSCTEVVVTLISGYSVSGTYGEPLVHQSLHQRTTRSERMLSLRRTSGTTAGTAPRSSAHAVMSEAAVIADSNVVACFFHKLFSFSSFSLNTSASFCCSSLERDFQAVESL